MPCRVSSHASTGSDADFDSDAADFDSAVTRPWLDPASTVTRIPAGPGHLLEVADDLLPVGPIRVRGRRRPARDGGQQRPSRVQHLRRPTCYIFK